MPGIPAAVLVGYHMARGAVEVVAFVLVTALYIIIYDLDETLMGTINAEKCADILRDIDKKEERYGICCPNLQTGDVFLWILLCSLVAQIEKTGQGILRTVLEKSSSGQTCAGGKIKKTYLMHVGPLD